MGGLVHGQAGGFAGITETQSPIERYLWEYNHDRPTRSPGARIPREAFVGVESDLRSDASSV